MCRSGAALSLCLSLWRSGPRSSMRRTIDAESVIDAEDHLVNFITLDDWVIREEQLGRAGSCTPEQQYEVAKESFMEKVMDKNSRARWVNGQWLVGLFGGVQERMTAQTAKIQAMKRKRSIDDTVDHDCAQELLTDANASLEQFKKEFMCSHTTGIENTREKVNIPSDMAANPTVPRADDNDFNRDIKRYVLTGVQRACNVHAQEEQDDHEAAHASKVARAAVARVRRPKKFESELKADVWICLRDRSNHITDAVNALNSAMEEVEKKALLQLTTMPEDLQEVLDSTKSDVETATKEMLAMMEELEKEALRQLTTMPEDLKEVLDSTKSDVETATKDRDLAPLEKQRT